MDRVVVFTAPEAMQVSKTWNVPGSNYRGRTVWVRYTDNAGTFSPIMEAKATLARLHVTPDSLRFLGDDTTVIPSFHILSVDSAEGCDLPIWSVHSSHSCLKASATPPDIKVWIDPIGLPIGTHYATLIVDAGSDVLDSPQTIPVEFTLVDQLEQVYLPIMTKGH